MITISPTRVTLILIVVVTLIMLTSIGTDAIDTIPEQVSDIFSVGSEENIPTWYSSVSLLICSGLAAVIATHKRQSADRFSRHWVGLAIIFLIFSIDETARLHEQLTRPVRAALDTSGLLYFAWVIPGIIFVLIFALAYLRFLWNLPPQTRWLFIISGTIFVAGAIGVESLNALLYDAYTQGADSVDIYNTLTDIEELLEMTGILVFIYTLVAYASQSVGRFELRFEEYAHTQKTDD